MQGEMQLQRQHEYLVSAKGDIAISREIENGTRIITCSYTEEDFNETPPPVKIDDLIMLSP